MIMMMIKCYNMDMIYGDRYDKILCYNFNYNILGIIPTQTCSQYCTASSIGHKNTLGTRYYNNINIVINKNVQKMREHHTIITLYKINDYPIPTTSLLLKITIYIMTTTFKDRTIYRTGRLLVFGF